MTEGNAIGIHPSVCAGYGADFDGDQMAIHVPLANTAQDESVSIMMATNNLLRPADGEPIMTPNRDVFLGLYYLTKLEEGEAKKVCEENEAVRTYHLRHLRLREPIKINFRNQLLETSVGRIFFNQALPEDMRFVNEVVRGHNVKNILIECQNRFGKERTVELIDALKGLGFRYATASGVSMSITDAEVIPQKQKLIDQAESEVEVIEKNFRRGLITETEKARLKFGRI